MAWLSRVDLDCLLTSTVNIAELRYGILNQKSAADASHLTLWLENVVRPWFADRIVEADERALLRWRVLARDLERQRRPAPPVDLLIAAIAFENNLSIATRDVAPFAAAGVPVLNPWTGERLNGA
jgi:predicted nucleic acid-binding protein